MAWFRNPLQNIASKQVQPVNVPSRANEPLNPPLWDMPLTDIPYLVIDMETSGFSASTDLILSVAAGCMTGLNSDFSDFYYRVIRHEHVDVVSPEIWTLTGLTPEEVSRGEPLEHVFSHILQLAVNRVWVAHHSSHEMSFLQRQARLLWKMKLRPIVIDTAVVAQALGGLSRVPTLDEVCAWLGVDASNRHRADADVHMTAEVWRKEMSLCRRVGLETIAQVIDWASARAIG